MAESIGTGLTTAATPFAVGAPVEHVFPTLTAEQIRRVEAHGRRRPVAAGEVLLDADGRNAPFFVVTAGTSRSCARSAGGEEVVVVHGPGQFTGEMTLLSGAAPWCASAPSSTARSSRSITSTSCALVQTDSELSEILMRAFILRRVELIAHGLGDVVLVGSPHSAGTLRVKEFLTRNGHPYSYIDLEEDAAAQALLDRFHVEVEDVPVLVCRGQSVLRNPTNEKIADCLGLNAPLDAEQVRDVVIVGAGPAGLAAAVYGASEGLDVLVLEKVAPGGQAGASSRIENYLGFPTGISGQELAGRALLPGPEIRGPADRGTARRSSCARRPYSVQIESGPHGAGAHRRHRHRRPVPQAGRGRPLALRGGGRLLRGDLPGGPALPGEEVIVVGGGNSAGQAAVFLAQSARHVHMLVRSNGLAESMSRYLIRRIERTPAITVRTQTEIVGLEGNGRLQRVRWRHRRQREHGDPRPVARLPDDGRRPQHALAGGLPRPRREGVHQDRPRSLPGRSDHGGLAAGARAPPAGDEPARRVRGGRRARREPEARPSAVGEGSTAIALVHQVLKE